MEACTFFAFTKNLGAANATQSSEFFEKPDRGEFCSEISSSNRVSVYSRLALTVARYTVFIRSLHISLHGMKQRCTKKRCMTFQAIAMVRKDDERSLLTGTRHRYKCVTTCNAQWKKAVPPMESTAHLGKMALT